MSHFSHITSKRNRGWGKVQLKQGTEDQLNLGQRKAKSVLEEWSPNKPTCRLRQEHLTPKSWREEAKLSDMLKGQLGHSGARYPPRRGAAGTPPAPSAPPPLAARAFPFGREDRNATGATAGAQALDRRGRRAPTGIPRAAPALCTSPRVGAWLADAAG